MKKVLVALTIGLLAVSAMAQQGTTYNCSMIKNTYSAKRRTSEGKEIPGGQATRPPHDKMKTASNNRLQATAHNFSHCDGLRTLQSLSSTRVGRS